MKSKRFVFCTVFVLIIGVVFTGRLINWQIIKGEEYSEIASNADSYKETLTAARGEIYDRNGKGLAVNVAGYEIKLNKIYIKDKNENEIIKSLINIFRENGDEFTDKLPVSYTGGKYFFDEKSEKEIGQIKDKYKIDSKANAEETIRSLATYFSCESYDDKIKRDIISVRYNMEKESFSEKIPYSFATSVNKTTVEAISENLAVLSGVQIKTSPQREYINGEAAPHIIGTIGAISKEEYEEKKQTNKYELNSKIGKTGIESAFEENLKGEDGVLRISSTQQGTTLSEEIVKETVNGDNLYLTVDADLQIAAINALKENCVAAQKLAKKDEVVTGSIVLIDLKDFSVLCAQSYPNFDLNNYYQDKTYYNSIVADNNNNPLFARAFEGCYAIGSTMKPAVAIAALQEGVINEKTKFNCKHVYTRFSPNYTPKCLGTHGTTDLREAMAESCNIFFFETANLLGISKMNEYQSALGLGEKTGIEINEKQGVLAGPSQREANGGTWYDGDTIAAAIGQSDNLITPIQLAVYCASIANNGIRYKTHILKQITSYDGTVVKLENKSDAPQLVKNLNLSKKTIDIVKEDMRAVVTSAKGTAHATLGNYSVPIAAKTGTAQVTSNKSAVAATDTSTLIAFAPYDKPQIAAALVMEYTKSGVYTANVLKSVLDEYFNQI